MAYSGFNLSDPQSGGNGDWQNLRPPASQHGGQNLSIDYVINNIHPSIPSYSEHMEFSGVGIQSSSSAPNVHNSQSVPPTQSIRPSQSNESTLHGATIQAGQRRQKTTQALWERYKPEIIRLYVTEGKSQTETMEIMRKKYNFDAS
jgi:hypothetical protein